MVVDQTGDAKCTFI